MKQSEIDNVVELRLQKIKFPEIAKRLGISVHAVKRRWYARNSLYDTPKVNAHYSLLPPRPPECDPLPSLQDNLDYGAELRKSPLKILFFDIETAPIQGWSWRYYEDNFLRVHKDWFLLSFAYKWVHEDKIKTLALCDYPDYEKDKLNDTNLVFDLWRLLNEADIVIAHNGDGFDLKKANTRFCILGLGPVSEPKTVDTLKVARRYFSFSANKLNFLAISLGYGGKVVHTGEDLWFGCMDGKKESWDMMKEYNIHDVYLLEKVYLRLRPWIKNHPNLHIMADGFGVACNKCMSTHVQKRGWEMTLTTKRQKYQCQDCGGWFKHGPPLKKPDPVLALYKR